MVSLLQLDRLLLVALQGGWGTFIHFQLQFFFLLAAGKEGITSWLDDKPTVELDHPRV